MYRYPVLMVAALLAIVSNAEAQTVYNTMVVTNQGQFVNARLDDNVYVDMTTSPPRIRARRSVYNVRPVEQLDGSWLIPATVLMTSTTQLTVILNGLEATEDVDYKRDPVNPRRLIPFADKRPLENTVWHYISAAGTDEGPYLVKVHLHP